MRAEGYRIFGENHLLIYGFNSYKKNLTALHPSHLLGPKHVKFKGRNWVGMGWSIYIQFVWIHF